jgi:hypothetical protein
MSDREKRKNAPREWDDVAVAAERFSSGDQSRLATYGTFGLHPVLSASSSLPMLRQTRVVVPFNVLGYKLGRRRS